MHDPSTDRDRTGGRPSPTVRPAAHNRSLSITELLAESLKRAASNLHFVLLAIAVAVVPIIVVGWDNIVVWSAAWAMQLLAPVFGVVIGAILTGVVGRDLGDPPRSAGAGAQLGLRRFWDVLGVRFVVGLVTVFLRTPVQLVVSWLLWRAIDPHDYHLYVQMNLVGSVVATAVVSWVYARWLMAMPSAVFEGLGVSNALRRSASLWARHRVPLLVVVFAVGCIDLLPAVAQYLAWETEAGFAALVPIEVWVSFGASVVWMVAYSIVGVAAFARLRDREETVDARELAEVFA